MNHQSIVAATILMAIFSATNAMNFNVNWVQNPKESLDAWSARLRFQINDNLMFKYADQAADSIFVVKKQDFDSCNSSSPLEKLPSGSSNYQLTRSGPYYFISSDAQKCKNGEKMMLVVISPRTKKQPVAAPPTISSPPSPPLVSPSVSPSSSSTPPSPSLVSPSGSPPSSSITPSSSPSTSPANSPSTTPNSPLASPTTSPSSSIAPSPSSLAPSSKSMSPTPFGGEITPPPTAGVEGPVPGPALSPKPTSEASALDAAGATVLMAVVIVANVFLV